MGLETIDSHSQKEHTEIHKILKFVLIRLVFTGTNVIFYGFTLTFEKLTCYKMDSKEF